MRLPTIFASLLLTGCASIRQQQIVEADIVAKLISTQPAQVGCGVLHIGSPATYKVIEGPRGLTGKVITVLVGCIEMPRSMYRRYAGGRGNLDAFTPGQVHYLSITKENIYEIEVPNLPAGMYSFYLRAASSEPLRPNNSFKPTPLRGVGKVP